MSKLTSTLEPEIDIGHTLSNVRAVINSLDQETKNLITLISATNEIISDVELSFAARTLQRQELVERIRDKDMELREQLARCGLLYHNIQMLKASLDQSICHEASSDPDEENKQPYIYIGASDNEGATASDHVHASP
jgi:hypothetical protein